MFKQLKSSGKTVLIELDGEPLEVPAGVSVAAAMLLANASPTRTTPVSNAPRAPFCMMGACFDCLMEIDGRGNQRACMTDVRDGMRVRRQRGAIDLVCKQ